VPVEVVATASEYVPRTTKISHPGHAYTDCQGNTSYLGDFNGREDSNGRISGDVSGRASTDTQCKTTFTPPSETSLTRYDRVNYTIARYASTLYLLSCTQRWTLSRKERLLVGLTGAAAAGSGDSSNDAAGRISQNARGTWTKCPAFSIGAKYSLAVHDASDARLGNGFEGKPAKLDYLGSAPLPLAAAPISAEAVPGAVTKVHVTSAPSGGEIYIDGKFFGNAPSDINLAAGEHTVKVTIGGKEWTRTVQITGGEIQLRADFP
jgi:hypothetical protein